MQMLDLSKKNLARSIRLKFDSVSKNQGTTQRINEVLLYVNLTYPRLLT